MYSWHRIFIHYAATFYYSMKSCSALEELDLSENENLSRLPYWFGAMSSLRILDVSECSLAAIPERYVNSINITSTLMQIWR